MTFQRKSTNPELITFNCWVTAIGHKWRSGLKLSDLSKGNRLSSVLENALSLHIWNAVLL